jgi:hypothetical protein
MGPPPQVGIRQNLDRRQELGEVVPGQVFPGLGEKFDTGVHGRLL